MSHKSIVSVLAGLFCLGVATSVLFLSNVIFYPEFFYAMIFALLVIVCIVFFKLADKGTRKSKKQNLVKVVDSDVIIFSSENAKSRKSLFLKVSIIALAEVFKRK